MAHQYRAFSGITHRTPPPWIWSITAVTRYQVDVKMRHSLTGGGAVVDAYVVALRLVAAGYFGLCLVLQREKGAAFFCCEFKERTDTTARNDESVAKPDGVGIPNNETERVTG